MVNQSRGSRCQRFLMFERSAERYSRDIHWSRMLTGADRNWTKWKRNVILVSFLRVACLSIRVERGENRRVSRARAQCCCTGATSSALSAIGPRDWGFLRGGKKKLASHRMADACKSQSRVYIYIRAHIGIEPRATSLALIIRSLPHLAAFIWVSIGVLDFRRGVYDFSIDIIDSLSRTPFARITLIASVILFVRAASAAALCSRTSPLRSLIWVK